MPKELFYLWLLFWISTVSSSGELITAWLLANSAAAQADALHALSHSAWYGVAIYEYKKFGHSIFDSEEDGHAHHHFTVAYAILFFVSLGAVLIEAVFKLIHPAPIIPTYMLLSAGIGISGNIISIAIIWRMKPFYNVNPRFDQIWWHALADIGVSVPVFSYALFLYFFPQYSSFNFPDSALTFTIVIYLGVKAYPLFFGEKSGHIKHHH